MLTLEELQSRLIARTEAMLRGPYQCSAPTDEDKALLLAEKALWQFDKEAVARLYAYLQRIMPLPPKE